MAALDMGTFFNTWIIYYTMRLPCTEFSGLKGLRTAEAEWGYKKEKKTVQKTNTIPTKSGNYQVRAHSRWHRRAKAELCRRWTRKNGRRLRGLHCNEIRRPIGDETFAFWEVRLNSHHKSCGIPSYYIHFMLR